MAVDNHLSRLFHRGGETLEIDLRLETPVEQGFLANGEHVVETGTLFDECQTPQACQQLLGLLLRLRGTRLGGEVPGLTAHGTQPRVDLPYFALVLETVLVTQGHFAFYALTLPRV